jgi:hypothetical protein
MAFLLLKFAVNSLNAFLLFLRAASRALVAEYTLGSFMFLGQ